MLKVGITGNIAAGKSTVESLLIEKGYKVLDADDIAHDLLRDKTVKAKIVEMFNGYDVLEDGELSREKLGKIIFSNKQDRDKLESILHPLIKNDIRQFFSASEHREDVVFVAVPLLFEAKFEDLFDKIALVYADDDIRIERLIERNDLNEEMAQNRLDIQMSQDKKKPLSAYIIFNNNGIDDLVVQVDDFVEKLLAE